MKRRIGFLLILAMVISLMTVGVSADTLGKFTRIYGSEETAIDCRGFDDFYAGNMFAWFMLDTDIDAVTGYVALNRQVLGDSVIKSSVNDKIKIGGMTVKQHNVSSGNPYSAMVAFEENGEGKLRISIWLSWAGQSIQDIFQVEIYEEVVFEILPGLKVPDIDYTISNPTYVEMEPVKYKLDISALEFKDDPSNPGYTADKSEWMKPMFEDLAAQWVKVEAQVTPTKAPTKAPTATPTNEPQVTETPVESSSEVSSEEVSSQDSSSEESSLDSSEVTSEPKESEEPTESESDVSSEPDETGSDDEDDEDKGSVLPIIFAVLGVLVIGGGAGYFIYMKKKA